MLLTDLQQHFFAFDVKHAYRFEDLNSDIYKHSVTGKEVRLNIMYDVVPDIVAIIACVNLEIEVPPSIEHLYIASLKELEKKLSNE